MKRIPPTPMNWPDEKPKEVLVSDISIDGLIGDGLQALYREIKNLLMLSAKGKLEPNAARDLRDHLKMLFEIKDRESAMLSGLTEEQLQTLLAQVQSGTDK